MTKFVLPEKRTEITKENGCYEANPLKRSYLRMHRKRIN
jgi:hypothetical protein